MFKRLSIHFVVIFLLSLPSFAQPSGKQQPAEQPPPKKPPQSKAGILDTIIVTGSRLNQPITEIGSSVSVISSDDIKLSGYDFALDALATAPGVTVNANGVFGGQASVRIRGAASAQTLVLIDEVPVTDPTSPGGGYDFARLDTQNIERIEVLKGPQSTLWGTDAIGGVVSITTKPPKTGLNMFGEYGTYETYRGGASIGASGEQASFRLAMTGNSSQGISKADEDNNNSETDRYEAITLSAVAGVDLGDNAKLSAGLLWTDAATEFDSFAPGAQGNVADGDELSETEELSANLTLINTMFQGALNNQLLVGYSAIDRNNFNQGAPSFEANGARTLLRYQGTMDIDTSQTLAFGIEREDTTANDTDTSINSVFGLYTFKPHSRLTLTGGLRRDNHARFGNQTTTRFAAAYKTTPTTTLRASWGEGFKAPTIFQATFFCCGASQPNDGLMAETSQAFDIGLDWQNDDGRAEAGIAFFNQDTENQINFSFAEGIYENIDNVSSQGFELYASRDIIERLQISAHYSYIEAEDSFGNTLAQLPKHAGNIVLNFDPRGPFSSAIFIHYNGQERNTDFTRLDDWTRLDLTCRYMLNEKVELYGRIENVSGMDYQNILGYGTPDRAAKLGIKLSY